jgi:hypothetical protein
LSEELVLPVIGKRLFFDRGCSAGTNECVGVVEVIGRQVHTHVLVYNEPDVVLIGFDGPRDPEFRSGSGYGEA